MKGISIFSLAFSFSFLVSNVASAETLRLECNISSACMMAKGASCTFINSPVSLLTDIDLRLKNWIQYWTQRDGAVSTSSGKLSSIDETKIVFAKGPAGSGEEEAISRIDGRYISTKNLHRANGSAFVLAKGSCAKSTKPLPQGGF